MSKFSTFLGKHSIQSAKFLHFLPRQQIMRSVATLPVHSNTPTPFVLYLTRIFTWTLSVTTKILDGLFGCQGCVQLRPGRRGWAQSRLRGLSSGCQSNQNGNQNRKVTIEVKNTQYSCTNDKWQMSWGYPPPAWIWPGYPPRCGQTDGWTDTCQNITFPRTTYAVGKNIILRCVRIETFTSFLVWVSSDLLCGGWTPGRCHLGRPPHPLSESTGTANSVIVPLNLGLLFGDGSLNPTA